MPGAGGLSLYPAAPWRVLDTRSTEAHSAASAIRRSRLPTVPAVRRSRSETYIHIVSNPLLPTFSRLVLQRLLPFVFFEHLQTLRMSERRHRFLPADFLSRVLVDSTAYEFPASEPSPGLDVYSIFSVQLPSDGVS
jgi:hypothetical protein